MNKSFTVEFVKERETKGAILYKELANGKPIESMYDGKIGSLYVRKSALESYPNNIKVTVEY